MSETGNFFQVDHAIFHAACDVGLNAAVAYLFLACGTNHGNSTSTWSTHSIEKYTGLGRGQAKRAIENLVNEGFIAQIYAGRGITARYQLTPAYALPAITKRMKPAEVDKLAASEPEWIWLPNTLVTGAKDEIPPVERIRRSQDVRVLKLLVELYHLHEIADRGGLPWRVVRKTYNRKQFTERGPWIIWQFTSSNMISAPDARWWDWFQTGPDGKRLKGEEWSDASWNAWKIIQNAGLLECVEHLVEGDTDESAIIYPCPMRTGTDAEQQVGQAAGDAAENMLGETLGFVGTARGAQNGEIFLPVDRAYPHVQMVGIYRLIYRPLTSMTAAWHARQFEYEKMAQGFRELASNAMEGLPLQNRVA